MPRSGRTPGRRARRRAGLFAPAAALAAACVALGLLPALVVAGAAARRGASRVAAGGRLGRRAGGSRPRCGARVALRRGRARAAGRGLGGARAGAARAAPCAARRRGDAATRSRRRACSTPRRRLPTPLSRSSDGSPVLQTHRGATLLHTVPRDPVLDGALCPALAKGVATAALRLRAHPASGRLRLYLMYVVATLLARARVPRPLARRERRMIDSLLSLALVLAIAPLLPGIASRTRAAADRAARRAGLAALSRTSGSSRGAAPCTAPPRPGSSASRPWPPSRRPLAAALLVPLDGRASLLSLRRRRASRSPYVLALGRFALVLGALDTGSSFEGMGASRDVDVREHRRFRAFCSTFSALAVATGDLSLSGMFGAALAARDGRPDGAARPARAGSVRADARRVRRGPGGRPGDAPRAHDGARGDGARSRRARPRADPVRRRAQARAVRRTRRRPHCSYRAAAWPAAGVRAGLVAGASACAVAVGVVESVTARLRMAKVPLYVFGSAALGGVRAHPAPALTHHATVADLLLLLVVLTELVVLGVSRLSTCIRAIALQGLLLGLLPLALERLALRHILFLAAGHDRGQGVRAAAAARAGRCARRRCGAKSSRSSATSARCCSACSRSGRIRRRRRGCRSSRATTCSSRCRWRA